MHKNRKIFTRILLAIVFLSITALAFLMIFRGVSSNLPASSFQVLDATEGADEYAVYSALLKALFVKDDVKLLVIQKQTSYCAPPDCKPLGTVEERIADMKKNLSPASEETLRDYEFKNTQPLILNSNFDLPVEYILLDQAELKKDQDGDRADSFYEKNFQDARGMIILSNVAFNKDRTEAIVLVELLFCPLCREGDTVLLEKKSGMWTVKKNFGGWIS